MIFNERTENFDIRYEKFDKLLNLPTKPTKTKYLPKLITQKETQKDFRTKNNKEITRRGIF